MSEPIRHYDAVVVGAGLAGRAAAVAVAKAGLETLHLAPGTGGDQRTSALMLPSVDYLRRAGLVGDPAAFGQPLRQIRIIDATGRLIRAPETLFDSAEADLDAFGWNFANARLGEAFATAAKGLSNLTTSASPMAGLEIGAPHRLTLATGETVTCDLLVGADGKKSTVRDTAGFAARERDFAEAALVCDLDLGRPLDGCSVEFHYPHGPFTLVPAGGNRANLVWIDIRATLDAVRAAGPEALARTLYDKSQHLFGPLALASPSVVFPLSTITVREAGRNGVALVGESAHAFPPIGAQGLNLGLRDVSDLAQVLAATDRTRPDWAETASADYARRRAPDLARTTQVVDALFRSLLAGWLPAQALRAGGLWALKALPPLRHKAFSLGMGQR